VWRAYAVGWLARSFRVEDRGRAVGSIEFGTFGERGALELDGRRLAVRREGFWHPRFVLSDGRAELATGQSAGAFRRGFRIVHAGEEYRLDPSSFFGRSYALSRRGRCLGTVRALGLFWRRAQIEIDEELSTELRLFAFWLAVLAWRRAAATAAAG
jgi:hypothetical protein